MTAVFLRVGNPVPGKQTEALKYIKERVAAVNAAYGVNAEVFTRFDGPLGQLGVVSRHTSVAEIEEVKGRVNKDVLAGKIAPVPAGVFQEIRDFIYTSA